MKVVVRLVVLTAVLALSVVAVAPAAAAPYLANPPYPPAPSAQPAPILGVHTVAAGETLDCIGRAYKVVPGAIAQANGVTGSVAPGQKLNIPAVAWLNPTGGTTCTAQFTMPAGWPILGQHTIQQGEWIYSIARAYRVDPMAIAQASGIQPPYTPVCNWCGGWHPSPCGGCDGWQGSCGGGVCGGWQGSCGGGWCGGWQASPCGWCGGPWNFVYPGQVLQIPGVWWYNMPAGPVAPAQSTVKVPW
jgi:LysM repeat protein